MKLEIRVLHHSLLLLIAQIAQGEMNLSETTNVTNSTGGQLAGRLDPDADVAFGFWLNGVGIISIGLIGILGNIASIKVLSHKQMRSSVNFILIALAFCDLLLIVTSIMLFALTTVYPYNGMLKAYNFVIFPFVAVAAYPLGIMTQTISIYMTFLISLERFIAVCHPLKARGMCTQARTKICIYIVVLLSIVYNIPKFFEVELKHGKDDDYGEFYYVSASDLRRNRLYITIYIHWLYFIFMNFIPLSGITYFNIMIYRQVRIVNRLRIKLTTKERQDIKLTTMLFCVVITFLTCNFLAVFTNIWETFYGIHSDRLTKLSNFLVTINSSVNFIIYVVLVKKFRTIFIRQFKSLIGSSQDSERRKIKFMRQQTISTSDSDQTTNDTA